MRDALFADGEIFPIERPRIVAMSFACSADA